MFAARIARATTQGAIRSSQRVYLSRSFGKKEQMTADQIQAREEEMLKTMPKHHMVFDPATNKMAHPAYDPQDIEDVKYIHYTPKHFSDKLANALMSVFRKAFDLVTGYSETSMNEIKWYRRVIFLETVAGCPGFVGGMCRHLRSLRAMQRDKGWINQLLSEAENERQHLMTFMELRQPGFFFRLLILLAQGIFMNAYFVGYILSPKVCHRFVGYLEEQAVKTYTHFLHDIDHGNMHAWGRRPASEEAKRYWGLPEGATLRDVVLAVRADEAIHRDFNHYLADIPKDSKISHEHIEVYNKRFRSAEGNANSD